MQVTDPSVHKFITEVKQYAQTKKKIAGFGFLWVLVNSVNFPISYISFAISNGEWEKHKIHTAHDSSQNRQHYLVWVLSVDTFFCVMFSKNTIAIGNLCIITVWLRQPIYLSDFYVASVKAQTFYKIPTAN